MSQNTLPLAMFNVVIHINIAIICMSPRVWHVYTKSQLMEQPVDVKLFVTMIDSIWLAVLLIIGNMSICYEKIPEVRPYLHFLNSEEISKFLMITTALFAFAVVIKQIAAMYTYRNDLIRRKKYE